MQTTSTTEQRGFFVFEGLWGYPETKCTPKLVILLRQDWSVCRTRTVSWNVLEQTVYYIRVHTYTNTHCNFSRFKNKMPIRKGWAGTVKDVRKKNKEKKKGCREETFTSKLKKKQYGPLISQVSVGCAGLFFSVSYNTTWAMSPQILLDSHCYCNSWPHNGVLGYYMSEVGGDWQMTKSSAFKNDDFHVDFCL